MKLFLDDERMPSWVGYDDADWHVVRTVAEAIRNLQCGDVTMASLDHDLGVDEAGKLLPTGYDLVKWMAETGCWPSTGVFVHSMNPVGRANMQAMIDRYFPR